MVLEEKAPPLAPLCYRPPDGKIAIIHHDDDILVLDKPSGLLSVPGKSDDHKDCLESRVCADFPSARIVHRLDMDTSGLIVMALSADAHRHLGLQFERRHIGKTYKARVWGHLAENTGTIDLPLRCDWPNRPRQMVDLEEGRSAITDWEVLARDEISTWVQLYPKTGRSHQLRVHMLELGHPILGDNLYAHEGARAATARLCLHAEKIELYHPTDGARLSFEAECPF